MEVKKGEFLLSDKQNMISLEDVYKLLKYDSYWGKERTMQEIKTSINNSKAYGLYKNGRQIGFARVISDQSTFYFFCDFIIHKKFRGIGLGKWMGENIIKEYKSKGVGTLFTRDLEEFYEKFSFFKDSIYSEKLMIKI